MNMQEDRIIGMARALGKAIQNDERYLAVQRCREENDADAALQQAIGAFNLVRLNLNQEIAKEDRDEEKVASLNDEMQRTYALIINSASMKGYQDASNELNVLVRQVTAVLSGAANGEDPDTIDPTAVCGGNCGGCAGCGQ